VGEFEGVRSDSEWLDSGWHRLLPHQAATLRLLAIRAELRDYEGGLDALVLQVGHSWFDTNTYGGLDAEVRWQWSVDSMSASREEREQWRREVCFAALAEAGISVPSTVRELADAMVLLGLLTVERRGTSDEQWRTHRFLPRPDEVLTLAEEWLAEDSQWRWRDALDPAITAFWSQWERRRSPEHWRTSINKLAKSTQLPPDSIRYALGFICQQEWAELRPNENGVQISTTGHEGPFDADPERVLDSKTIYLHFLPSPALQAALDKIDQIFGPKKDS
jgi:hypothetical protein